MDTLRRGFLQNSSLGALAAALNLTNETVSGAQARPQGVDAGTLDPDVYDFWSNQVRSPYQDYLMGVKAKTGEVPGPQDSTFVFPSSKRGLVPAATLMPDDVKDFPSSGDMDVEVHVERFRPSAADTVTLSNLQSGTLRIDVKQVKPLEGLPEALAWTAMATLASRQKNQQMPSIADATFDPGTAWGQFQTIPLTGGLGFWSWNFFMKRREGFWGLLLDHFFQSLTTAQPFLPILGIPGIAVSGLGYVDKILGAVQAQGDSKWMFKGLDVAVCATTESFSQAGANGANKMLLTTGSYIIMPEVNVGQLDGTLEIQSGLLVPPNTPPLKIFDAAKLILPEVSYMTISVTTSASKKAAAVNGNVAQPAQKQSAPVTTSATPNK